MNRKTGVAKLAFGWRNSPVFLPFLDPNRYRIKAAATAIPESCVLAGEIDLNRQSYQPARRFDLEGGLSIGDSDSRVLVCLSNLPESRLGGRLTAIRWNSLPVKPEHLRCCWLLFLGHESLNLKVNDLSRRISKASAREGTNFAWYAFDLAKIFPHPTIQFSKAAIKGLGIYPPLPSWKAEFRAAAADDAGLTNLCLTAEARQPDTVRRAA